MGVFKDWVRAKMPDKVITDGGVERYVHKDWDMPPTPEAVVRAGLAATIEEAKAAIPNNKQWWGGSRLHVDLDAMDSVFSAVWPASAGAKPSVLASLLDADNPLVDEGGKQVRKPLGYTDIFKEWAARGLIR